MKRRIVLIGTVTVAALVVLIALFAKSHSANALEYVTVPATVGSLRTIVNATGTIQPNVTVQVGTQVSGQVVEIYADFNSVVKHGQILARIDPRTFQSQVTNAQAKVLAARSSVQNAEAQRDTAIADIGSAKANVNEAAASLNNANILYKRAQDLSKQGLISKNDLDVARTNSETTNAKHDQTEAALHQTEAKKAAAEAQIQQMRAQLAQAEADLSQAQVNLGYTTIVSPVDGVVISRTVDVGQTIAASLQSPTLFTIANDLTRMQVNASVDEADVGKISSDADVRFTVDAYPNENFRGRIHEIRLSPTTVQNVVTYNAILDIDNSELKLKPGMTANINITVDRRDRTLKIPNAALRYAPSGMTPQRVEVTKSEAANENPAAPANQAKVPDTPLAPGQKWDPREKIQFERPRDEKLRSGQVWVLNAQGKPEGRSVLLGITDGTSSEVVSGAVKEADPIIVGDSSQSVTPAKPQNRTMNPLLPMPRGGRR